MPIFQYAPRDSSVSGEERMCCYFDFLHRPGEHPLSDCPHCGRPIKKIPAMFSAQQSRQSKTSNALRAAGKSDFAEAWEEAQARRMSPQHPPTPESLAESLMGQDQVSSSRRVLESMKHHVCTADCRHGSPVGEIQSKDSN